MARAAKPESKKPELIRLLKNGAACRIRTDDLPLFLITWQGYPNAGLGILLWMLDFYNLPPDHNVVIF